MAILEGITGIRSSSWRKNWVIRLWNSLSRDQLYMADEVFVSGTAAECIGLREIDFRTIGSGKTGPVTKAIQHAFHAAIHGNHPRSKEWLDYVS
jgi:branched-chain amino acid aminotransferase